MAVEIKGMSVDDLMQWLKKEGIPEEFCQKFEGF